MNVAFLGPHNQFADALRQRLASSLAPHTLVDWNATAPNPEVDLLISLAPVTGDALQTAPRLALIQTASDGYDAVDIPAATKLGIWVSFSPGNRTGNADSVAEYAVLLLLATARNLNLALASIQNPAIKRPMLNATLLGKTVCIVGPGAIGQRVAARLQPFGVHLTSVARHPETVPSHLNPQPFTQLKQTLATADFVVLTVRATSKNKHLVNRDLLAAMKKGAILVNIARGSLIDETALLEAVRSGHLAGAGLDVLEHEPPSPTDPLLAEPRIFVTPHIAGFTQHTLDGTARYLTQVVQRFAQNRRPASLLNQPTTPRHPLS